MLNMHGLTLYLRKIWQYSCAVVNILQNHVIVLLNLQTCCVCILVIFCPLIPLLS